MGRATVTGHAEVRGKSYITCNAHVGRNVVLVNEVVGGEDVRK